MGDALETAKKLQRREAESNQLYIKVALLEDLISEIETLQRALDDAVSTEIDLQAELEQLKKGK